MTEVHKRSPGSAALHLLDAGSLLLMTVYHVGDLVAEDQSELVLRWVDDLQET